VLGRILSIGFFNTGTYGRDVAIYKVIDNPNGTSFAGKGVATV
jgi:hypothetical protein